MTSDGVLSRATLVSRSLYERLRFFEAPRARRIAMALGILLVLPSLFIGLSMDDYVLLYYQRSDALLKRGPLDLFAFEHQHWIIDGAGLPWWSMEQSANRFLRPISSLTHAADAWLWPNTPWLMHAHSIAWFALCLVLANRLYARLEGPWVAGVATLFFSVEDVHGVPVSWIANRNAVMATAFGIAALLVHDRARRARSLPFSVLAALLLACSVLSAELGVGTVGYLAAYALCLDDAPIPRRIRSLLPAIGVLVAYAVVYKALGYGTRGLGSYHSPLAEPWEFVRFLPERLALLSASQLGGLYADLWFALTPGRRSFMLVGAFAVVGISAWFLWPTLKSRRASRFWVIGALLSAVPTVATTPSDRLLMLVSLGGLAAVAAAVEDAWKRLPIRGAGEASGTRDVRYRAGAACVAAVVHIVVSAISLPLRPIEVWIPTYWNDKVDRTLPQTPEIAEKTAIVVQVPTSMVIAQIPVTRIYRDIPRPKHLYWLVAALASARVERLGPNVLRVSPQGGFYNEELERHYRGTQSPLEPGDRIELSEMTVEVVNLTPDGRPAVCDFYFRSPLESPKYEWFTWTPDGLIPFALPSLSETIDSRLGQR
jgi:hypothetical protein